MANEKSKRYVCGQCGTEMLVMVGGDGQLTCCGQPMQIRGATPAAGAQQPKA
jgi:desulfoferrodoxin-like iron-binding protein